VLLFALTVGICPSCSEQRELRPAMAAASEHFAAFERFERWAVRSVRSDVRLQGKLALRETLFAPLRHNRVVAWADVHWESDQLLTYRDPIPDAQLTLVPIEAPSLGRVLVAVCEACKQAGQGSECVVIERPERQRPARVRMAFCKVEPEPQVSAPKPRAPAARPKKQPQARAQASK
jgi:hypothetical protein